MTQDQVDQCRPARPDEERSNEVARQVLSASTSINVVNSIDERRQTVQQSASAGSSNRIYRELEAGGYSSGSSRASGSTGTNCAVPVRAATLDFTDIGEEVTYSDDNLCEDQPAMVGLKSLGR